MKKVIFILLFPALCFSQHKMPYSKNVVSKKNEIILSFVEANIGKRVGGGVCSELVHKSIKKVNKNWRWKNVRSYGRRVWLKKNIMPGDFVIYKKVTIDGYYMEYHVSVLYKILPKGEGYLIAEQNVVDRPKFKTRKDSKVVLGELSSLYPDKGKIKIRRVR